MFMRFSERVRKVILLASEEARRLNHQHIGTEYVLLGIVNEGGGVAATVLKSFDIDLHRVRAEVERLVESGTEKTEKTPMVLLPVTPGTEKVFEFAIEESTRLNHNFVGTEHLLLGLLRERNGIAAQVLTSLGVKLEETREKILALPGAGSRLPSELTGGFGDTMPPDLFPTMPGRGLADAAPFEGSPTNDPAATLLQSLLREFAACKDRAVMNADYEMAVAYRDMTETAQQLMNELASFLARRQPPKDNG